MAAGKVSVVTSLDEVPGDSALVILEIRCEDDSDRAIQLLEQTPRSLPVWIYDPSATVGTSVSWMKAGAAHVVSDAAELESALNLTFPDSADSGNISSFENPDLSRDEFSLRASAGSIFTGTPLPSNGSAGWGSATWGSAKMIGASRSMREIHTAIRMVGNRQCSVLIQGETGTGKEVVAREIHSTGNRSRGPWVAVNCSAIPEPLLEAELFGYLKGAFTGAQHSRAGKFEAANHGTIFLDEIGDMPVGIQAKLLRVLQEREIERLGGNDRIRLDIRVIAATNVDLEARIKDGRFRQDLFYRLNVFQISLPSLRERPDDIPMLARHFVRKICNHERIPIKMMDRSALDRLRTQSWPGNVRELENAIETAVIVSGDRPVIFAADLRPARSAPLVPARTKALSLPPEGLDYQSALEDFEVALLTQALTRVRGNKTAAADLLGLKRTTLAAKMKALESRFPLLAA